MWRGFCFAVGWAMVGLLTAGGVQAEQPPQSAPPTYEVPQLPATMRVDGVLDEPAWSQAVVIEIAYEVSPGDNLPAPVRTRALLFHSGTHLCMGFRAFDHEPSKIRARLADRDTPFEDDFVGVILDTFNDERAPEILRQPARRARWISCSTSSARSPRTSRGTRSGLQQVG
jgi:hypothetical protein